MSDSRHYPIAAIMAAAVVVFLARSSEEGRRENAEKFGAIPAQLSAAAGELRAGQLNSAVAARFARLATALFIHADFQHLLLNMVMLWPFGVLIAERLGPGTAMGVFFLCGMCGNVLQVCLNLQSPAPIIGASGAICGLEGVYFGLAVRWQLPDPDVWPLAHPIPPLQLAAFAIAGFLFDAYSLMNHNMGIAYGAHMGGFISGIAFAAIVTTLWPTAKAWRGSK